MHRAIVDFPDPDSPTSPKISPRRNWKETPSRARSTLFLPSRKQWETPCTSSRISSI